MRRTITPALAAACLAMPLAVWAAGSTPLSGDAELALVPAPMWVVSAAWGPDDELLIVDALGREVRSYSSSGDSSEISSWRKVSVEVPKPGRLLQDGDRYVLEADSAYLVDLDHQLAYGGESNLMASTEGREGAITTLYDWSFAGPDRLISFSDVKLSGNESGEQGWATGFVEIPLGTPDRFRLLKTVAVDDPARDYYLLGLHLFASLGDEAFALLMEESPRIVRFRGDGGAETLKAPILADLTVPPLPRPEGFLAEGVIELYATLERSTIPVGLYGWNGSLWVLTRSPESDGTRWQVAEVRTTGEAEGHVFELPTRAAHINLVPGDPYWGIIEKGPVEGFGKQDVYRAQLVRSSRFTP